MMKQTQLLLFFLLILMGSCSNHRVEMSRLAYIGSLMEVNPQIAYDSLRLDSDVFLMTGVRQVEMKYRLLMAEAQNKLYLQMPSDSTFQEVVTYYDVHGNSNEKMKAYYLLGCVYRDQKEIPMTIQCYEKAVSCADTLDNACDFSALYRIYGQMADIYRKQNLFDEAIKAESLYCNYALRAKNMMDYIGGREQLATYFYSLGDTSKAMSQIQGCISLYKKNNMPQKAAAAVTLIIYIHLKRQQFDKAYQYMQLFEKNSRLFDEKGDVCRGREYYYLVKGQYLLDMNRLDSARFYFEKLDTAGFHFEAYKGLLAICVKLNDVKGVIKYADLFEKSMDDILKQNQADAVMQASDMYNFNKVQQESSRQALAKERAELTVVLLALIILILCFVGVQLFRIFKKKMKCKQDELEEHKFQLAESKKKIEAWNDKYLMAASELTCLQEKIKSYVEEYKRMKSSEKRVIIDDNEVFKMFKKMALGHSTQTPTEKQWKKLTNMISENFPIFFEKIRHNSQRQSLSSTEERVVMLTRLHFSTAEMAKVMKTSPASISNAKQSANTKLFDDKNAKSLFQNMLDI